MSLSTTSSISEGFTPSTDMTIRPAGPDDCDDIAELDYELFPNDNFNEVTFRDLLHRGGGWVAIADQRVVGYAIAVNGYKLADLVRVGVKEAHQRRGLGRSLVTEAIKRYGTVMLCCRLPNTRALGLYHSLGFRIVGKVEGQTPSWVMVHP